MLGSPSTLTNEKVRFIITRTILITYVVDDMFNFQILKKILMQLSVEDHSHKEQMFGTKWLGNFELDLD